MKLVAKKVNAISILLKDKCPAVLVQDGDEWEGFCKFKCISPQDLRGQTIIASKQSSLGSFSCSFNTFFKFENNEYWLVVKASPELIGLAQL